jgi:glycerol kinase
MMQFQADMLGIPVDRPAMVETTAVGAAYLAGLAVGLWSDLTEIESSRQVERVFTANMDAAQREEKYRHWQTAVELARKWGEMS